MLTFSDKLAWVGLDVRAQDETDNRLSNTLLSSIAFLKKWFTRTEASSAVLSLDPRDSYLQTAHEAQLGEGSLSTWEGTQKFLRGVFWALALGPELCSKLGGRDAVIREAPAAFIEPLGHGIWLQATTIPDADPRRLLMLEQYLARMLSWTREQTGAPGRIPASLEQPWAQRVRPLLENRTRGKRARIRVRFARNAGTDTGLNVHFSNPPPRTVREAVALAMQVWYADGVAGKFGGDRFHELSGPTIDESTMRWRIDFGSADIRLSVGALAQRLSETFGNATILRLVVGTERARRAAS